ncbi:MAG: Maf family protein [Opitutales bacterium]|nr:Maf family protein [Opitutales bacterium]NRA26402.1 septum formation protein Maf [Opitutales bacterium]
MGRDIILASGSPRRREILGRIVSAFRVERSDADEIDTLAESEGSPEKFVSINAEMKGVDVSNRFSDAVVLAADTTVFLDDQVLNKPKSMEAAHAMIRLLSGREHQVLTGVFISNGRGDEPEIFVETSTVHFNPLKDTDIERYFTLVDPLDKAGAYGIQAGTDIILKQIEGSFSNVMGLPEARVRRYFAEILGIAILPRNNDD